ncbi:MAG TPA: hypothetical protein VGB53_01335 [Rubricoccaceae bacterium]|jgi:hypothetical protein
MTRWTALALTLVLAGCTATRETLTDDPLRCVDFATNPLNHHGFPGAGLTRVALATGDTVRIWAVDRLRFRVGGTIDSLDLYTGAWWGEGGVPRRVPTSAIQGSVRPWLPLVRHRFMVGVGLGTVVALTSAAALSTDGDYSEADARAAMILGASGGAAGFLVVPFGYRRVDRCTVTP